MRKLLFLAIVGAVSAALISKTVEAPESDASGADAEAAGADADSLRGKVRARLREARQAARQAAREKEAEMQRRFDEARGRSG